MTTSLTTIPSDFTTDPEAHVGGSRGRLLAGGLAVFAIGAGLGWVGASAAADDTSVPTPVPAVVAVRPDAVPDLEHMTPDAALRWAEVERQQRVDHAACLRLSQGIVPC